jgi:hypothetical protein
MNAMAVVAWLFMNPLRELKKISSSALKLRLMLFVGLVALVIAALVYTKFLLPKKAASVIDRHDLVAWVAESPAGHCTMEPVV